MLQPYQQRMIGLLIKQEMGISRLYAWFAETFPTSREFWEELAQEEVKHAKWLRRMYPLAKQGLILFHEDELKSYALKNFISQVEQFITDHKQTSLSLLAAANFAITCEETLGESLTFSQVSSPIQELETVLTHLRQESHAHKQKIEQFQSKLRYARR
jgi:hypothetical protein